MMMMMTMTSLNVLIKSNICVSPPTFSHVVVMTFDITLDQLSQFVVMIVNFHCHLCPLCSCWALVVFSLLLQHLIRCCCCRFLFSPPVLFSELCQLQWRRGRDGGNCPPP